MEEIDSDEDAARATDEFLASLAYGADLHEKDGYASSDGEPVSIDASMMEPDPNFLPDFRTHRARTVEDDNDHFLWNDLAERQFEDEIEWYSPTLVPYSSTIRTPYEPEAMEGSDSADEFAGYLDPDMEPVRITAAMMADDDLWILSSGPEGVPTATMGDIVPPPNFGQASKTAQPTTVDPIPSRGHEQPLSYLEIFHAEITTVAHVDLHEKRIYRAGCTPAAIRGKIKSVLQNVTPKERLANFDPVNNTERKNRPGHSLGLNRLTV
jgi:hypothetical protein